MKTVCYLSCNRFSCTDIIICLDAALIKPELCPVTESTQPFDYHTIPGTLSCPIRVEGVCYNLFKYTITYDETLTTVELFPEMITAVQCRDCVATYIDELIGNDETFIQDEETGEATYTSPHGCTFTLQTGTSEVQGLPSSLLYGDGFEGDVTIETGNDEQLPFPVRDMFYENLTIDSGAILHPYGPVSSPTRPTPTPTSPLNDNNIPFEVYRIIVKDTLTINGVLSFDGESAVNASGTRTIRQTFCARRTGSTWYEGGAPGRCAAEMGPGGAQESGGYGGRGRVNGSTAAQAGSATAFNYGACCLGVAQPVQGGFCGGGYAGSGGAGAGAAAGAGGNLAGSSSVGIPFRDQYHTGRFLYHLWDYSAWGSFVISPICGGNGGAGGGGGGGSGTAQGGMGGGGGAGGGSIYISAKNIVINGTISAKGGNGGNGADGVAGGIGDVGGAGGGGGGGGGGLIYLMYDTITINSLTPFDVSAGVGGAGGTSVGTTNGVAGDDGLPGNVVRLNMTTGEFE